MLLYLQQNGFVHSKYEVLVVVAGQITLLLFFFFCFVVLDWGKTHAQTATESKTYGKQHNNWHIKRKEQFYCLGTVKGDQNMLGFFCIVLGESYLLRALMAVETKLLLQLMLLQLEGMVLSAGNTERVDAVLHVV